MYNVTTLSFPAISSIPNTDFRSIAIAVSQSVHDSDFLELQFKLVGQGSKQLHHCLYLDNMLPGHHHQEGARAFDSLTATVHLRLLLLVLEEV